MTGSRITVGGLESEFLTLLNIQTDAEVNTVFGIHSRRVGLAITKNWRVPESLKGKSPILLRKQTRDTTLHGGSAFP